MKGNPFSDLTQRLLRPQDAMLDECLQSGEILVRIIGPRRTGKTDLVLRHVGDAPFINVRIPPIPATYRPAVLVGEKWDNQIDKLRDTKLGQAYLKIRYGKQAVARQSIKAEVNMGVFNVQAQSENPEVQAKPTQTDDNHLVLHLQSLELAAEATGLRPIVFFDEVQELLCAADPSVGMATAWQIRNEIQAHRHVRYVLAGSNQKLFALLTQGKIAPFLNMGVSIHLPPLTVQEIEAWAIPLLKAGRRHVQSLSPLTHAVAGKIGEVVEVLKHIWLTTKAGSIIDHDVQLAAIEAVSALQPELNGVVRKLTPNQTVLLTWLLEHPHESPYAAPLPNGSIESALRSLAEDELIEVFGQNQFCAAYPLRLRHALLFKRKPTQAQK